MTSSSPLNFANQDLRNRSFKGQNLSGADFSGCDIRGCDFSYALLQDANLERVKAGQTPRQFITILTVAVIVALLAVDAFCHMIFAALGRTAAEPTWSYILALCLIFAIAGAFSGIRVMTGSKLIAGRVATIVSGTASGALLAFFYAGTTTDNNQLIATAAATIAAVVIALIIVRVRHGFVSVAVSVAGAFAGYGFAFFIGATAIAYLSSQNIVWGVVWGALSIGYIWLTMNSIILAAREIKDACGTSFRGADLTNAKFDGAKLRNTDFRGAIGYEQLKIEM